MAKAPITKPVTTFSDSWKGSLYLTTQHNAQQRRTVDTKCQYLQHAPISYHLFIQDYDIYICTYPQLATFPPTCVTTLQDELLECPINVNGIYRIEISQFLLFNEQRDGEDVLRAQTALPLK
jgi:hypothetical protein